MAMTAPPTYHFHQINHRVILPLTLLIGLTPLIPIPFVDDWIKSSFQRRMIRQIFAARGQTISPESVERLIEEDFWGSCMGGCAYTLLYYPLRELLSKLFFIVEWRRAYLLISQTYYTGFLLDSALMAGYRLGPHPDEARRMRLAIQHVRQGADFVLIQRVVRENARPGMLFRAAWQLFSGAVGSIPRMVFSLPGAIWQGIRSAPGWLVHGLFSIPARIRANFYLRVQVLLGREKAPELVLVERMAQNIQKTLLALPPDHFDDLHQRLMRVLSTPIPVDQPTQPDRQTPPEQ